MNTDGSLRSGETTGCAARRERATSSRIPAAGSNWSAQAGMLRVTIDRAAEGAATVRLIGELDVASAPLVGEALDVMTSASQYHVRLDLSAVNFCDCAGLNAFIAADELLRSAGGRLTLVRPSAALRRLLTLTDMDRLLDESAVD